MVVLYYVKFKATWLLLFGVAPNSNGQARGYGTVVVVWGGAKRPRPIYSQIQTFFISVISV